MLNYSVKAAATRHQQADVVETRVDAQRVRLRRLQAIPRFIRRVSNRRNNLKIFFRKERASKISVPLSVKLRMWRRGFLGESAVIYGKQSSELNDYLSDYARLIRTPLINGAYSVILNNKILFEACFRRHLDIPDNLGVIVKGRFIPTCSIHDLVDTASLLEFGRSTRGLVARPIGGGGGAGVHILGYAATTGFTLNGSPATEREILELLGRLPNHLVTPYITQAAYSSAVFPATANTIRVLTMVDPATEVPFVAVAVHRFGNKDSIPVDNWTQGGLSALLNLETGELGPGVTYPRNGRVEFHETHPDTGSQICGVRVPGWAAARDTLLNAARAWSIIPYIGWDILMTDRGFVVIEGNNFTDVNLLQVHGPLLRDQRIRQFYLHHRVLR